jgi:DNA modification methylase
MMAILLQGDCLETLKTLPACSVQCAVTSPPYYGLRDYGVEGQIGLEESPEAYVENLVAVFREARRVLKDDGTLWLNLGDSYWGANGNSKEYTCGPNGIDHREQARPSRFNKWRSDTSDSVQVNHTSSKNGKHPIIKPKDLIGIPWMVAFALRADGWYLRQDIIWSKPNPMPESVRDRCTKSHEYIFLFSKSRTYYYDQDAIREPYAEASLPRALRGLSDKNKWINGAPGSTAHTISEPRKNVRKAFEKLHGGGGSGFKGHSGYRAADGRLLINPLGRNKWSVWRVPTASYKEAHFATFPPDLITPCILAGSRAGDTVLDPFNGAGTTGEVSKRLGRHYIGCELNPAYVEMTMRRLSISPKNLVV